MLRRCRVCGESCELATCEPCAEVGALVQRIAEPLCVVVDGSYSDEWQGAGLVLVLDSPIGEFAALCACRFHARSSVEAEYQAIVRARRWAPGVPVYSDCVQAIDLVCGVSTQRKRLADRLKQAQLGVHFLLERYREPNHAFAHRLSRQGRLAARAAQRAKAAS